VDVAATVSADPTAKPDAMLAAALLLATQNGLADQLRAMLAGRTIDAEPAPALPPPEST